MAELIVRGGNRLSGSITPSGNKNEALPALAACLLVSKPVVLRNMPRIGDVLRMVEIVRGIGVEVEWLDEHTMKIDASGISGNEPDPDLCSRIRASFLLAGPLLARKGAVVLPRPGGDRIGRRRIDTHLLALSALGARIDVSSNYSLVAENGFMPAEIFLDEASVMATENTLMAAASAPGETVIYNSASEPHVQGLCRLLSGMGAAIDGIGSNVLRVQGGSLDGGIEHTISPDHIEIGSFIGLAAVTRSELTVNGVRPEHLRKILMDFRRIGVRTILKGNDLLIPGDQTPEIQADLGGAIPKIDDAPWPGFPADLTSIALVTASQSNGTVLIHEKMFESRLFFVDRLISMGARIVLCDPHRALVVGPTPLVGATLASPDIRAGMALLLAALAAKGESRIQNVEQIDRGYEKIEERLVALGASIEKVKDWDGKERRKKF
ncbi:MAG: UDP-N-acetylglucosamine 1-carboxyvinyltransferase [Deltaproteobacteria bacterium]|nr:UDP-N-acetylglucosamine 1-carboxyvinyltransferase [Deltaproteobacteria bacterium]